MKSDSLFSGSYMFHLHTTYTDGEISIPQYFRYAVELSIPKLVFLEHIRKRPTYDVHRLLDEVREQSLECGVSAHVGFEAKLLANGELDIDTKHVEIADVIGIADHGFRGDIWDLEEELRKAICAYMPFQKPIIWVHPGLCFTRQTCITELRTPYLNLVRTIADLGGIVEQNCRYGLVPNDIVYPILKPNETTVIGLDSHTWNDIRRWHSHKRHFNW